MQSKAIDAKELATFLAQLGGKPLVVHHFATWCDPCREELPMLGREMSLLDVAYHSVAISWDLFMEPVGPDGYAATLSGCEEMLKQTGARFQHLLLYTGTPEELFRSQSIATGTVPYTEVRSPGGETLAVFNNPITAEVTCRKFSNAVRSAAGASLEG